MCLCIDTCVTFLFIQTCLICNHPCSQSNAFFPGLTCPPRWLGLVSVYTSEAHIFAIQSCLHLNSQLFSCTYWTFVIPCQKCSRGTQIFVEKFIYLYLSLCKFLVCFVVRYVLEIRVHLIFGYDGLLV